MLARVAVPLVLLLTVGCGVGNLDLCRADCAAKGRCAGLDEVSCRQACDRMPGALSDLDAEENRMCRNAPELRQRKMDCYSRPCGEISACLQPLVAINQQNPLCVK
ncbi:MAG: hypothetical protein NZ890_01250 [Myxococcota bacterium]|nr:hypothetical protein [Myxococcota bacterium]